MKVEKFIAFQTVDREGDIWCNRAFLFKSHEDALAFFSNPKLVIDTLEYKVEERYRALCQFALAQMFKL